MPPTGGDREIVKVCSQENDTRRDRGRKDPDVHRDTAVEADSTGFHGPLHGVFKSQG